MSEPSSIGARDASEGSSPETSAIVTRLLMDGPEQVVLIGAQARALVDALSSRCSCEHFDTVESCAAAATDGREEAVAALWLSADEADADSALGMTCRLFPRQVLVRVSGKQPLMPASRFFAFGFQRVVLPEPSDCVEQTVLYEYRLADYKQPPDWLNARYWANPERFGVLEPEFDESGAPLPEGTLAEDEDVYEPEDDEYE